MGSALSSPLPAGKATPRWNAIRRSAATIAAWAECGGYDAAIWTALASNFDESGKAGEPFSVTAAIRYLEKLKRKHPAGFNLALDYIREDASPRFKRPCATQSPSAGLK